MIITIGKATFNKPIIINFAMEDGGFDKIIGCQIIGGDPPT
jgi:hypothetical protein